MASVSRKLQRKRDKEVKKDMQEKVKLFGKLPDQCNMCEKPFDKTSKKDVQSWRVIVREKEQRVNIYCPTCWDYAQELLESISKDLRSKDDVS